MKKLLVAYQAPIVYAALALTVLLPLLKPGYILTLDMVFAPHIRLPSITTSSYLFYAVLHVLNFVLPADLLQKMVLFVILFVSGLGMHRLWSSVFGVDASGGTAEVNLARYVAGAFYMINPYTYERFMAGQFAVLLGYCLLPYFATSLIKLLAQPDWKKSLTIGGWMTLISIVSIHTLGLIAVLLIVGCVISAWRHRHNMLELRQLATCTGVALAVFVVASSYWLVPLASGRSATGVALSAFTASDSHAFATLGGTPFGRLANVVRLQGFWAEATGTFFMPQAGIVGWGAIMLVVWALIAIGVYGSWQANKRFLTAWLGLSALVAILIAVGTFQSLIEHMPLLEGFREPHKFVGLVALVFALYLGQGTGVLLSRFQKRGQDLRYLLAAIAICILPLALTHTMLWGFLGQLSPVAYPATWTTMNQLIDHDKDNFRVLFLPWHYYMYYRFADRIIANPAPNFFGKPTIASNDPEFSGASPNSFDPTKALLTKSILPAAPRGSMLGAKLAPLHIKYILLDKDNDYMSYTYLDRQTDLKLISENANLKLYVNTKFKEDHATKS